MAVLSKDNSRAGKTAFIVLVSGLFTLLKRERAAVFSDSRTEDYPKMCSMSDDNKASGYMSVLRANLMNDCINQEDLFAYGRLISSTMCYVFDIMHATLSDVDIEEMFMKCVNLCESQLLFVDINGSKEEDKTNRIIESCDALFYLFNCDYKSIEEAKVYRESMPAEFLNITGFVCTRFDPRAISEKFIASKLGIKQRALLLFPYNQMILKSSMEGNLNSLCKSIMVGDPTVVDLRVKLQEILAFLFNEDRDKFKYIPDIKDWKIGE